MSINGFSMAVLPCRAEEDVEAGSAALRVDWPVYPRRAEHNTVAEGGNRRWAEIARQNAFQSRWPRPTRGPPAKASAEIDVAAVAVEWIPLAEPAHGPQTVKGGCLDVDEAFGRPDAARATEARLR